MPGVAIDASDITEVVAGLKQARQEVGKQQRKALKVVAEEVAGWARTDARSGTRAQSRFAGAIQGRSTTTVARITVAARGANRGAAVAFFGQRPLTRTGWNASRYNRDGVRLGGRRRTAGARPQGLPWVGNTWIGGRRGEGPYVINETIAKHLPQIEERLLEAHASAVESAFDGSNL